MIFSRKWLNHIFSQFFFVTLLINFRALDVAGFFIEGFKITKKMM